MALGEAEVRNAIVEAVGGFLFSSDYRVMIGDTGLRLFAETLDERHNIHPMRYLLRAYEIGGKDAVAEITVNAEGHEDYNSEAVRVLTKRIRKYLRRSDRCRG